MNASFSQRLVVWQRAHGRHGLPWQGTDPYRVWLSEIMLQQTQVATALPYYLRFVDRWPNFPALAAAHEDDVLAMWAGLGYYRRARMLHQCARMVVSHHSGQLPRQPEALEQLPGIGKTTAHAIASFCHGERVPILDGNVRRVLSRWRGMNPPQPSPAALKDLWILAHQLLPDDAADMPTYTQGLMDLGATVCRRHQPRCEVCPVSSDCVAQLGGFTQALPKPAPRTPVRHVVWHLLQLQRDDGAVWLEQRPARGIWARLWCLPCTETRDDLQQQAEVLAGQSLRLAAPTDSIRHRLTHRALELNIHHVQVDAPAAQDGAGGKWFTSASLSHIALPKPIERLLLQQKS